MPKKRILKQMFDVRPVDETGELDWEKIKRVEEEHEIFEYENASHPIFQGKNKKDIKSPSVYVLGRAYRSEEVPVKKESVYREPNINREKFKSIIYTFQGPEPETPETPDEIEVEKEIKEYFSSSKKIRKSKKRKPLKLPTISFAPKVGFSFSPFRSSVLFAASIIFVAILLGTFSYVGKGMMIKGKVMGVTEDGIHNFNNALSSLKKHNFEESILELEKAHNKFSEASSELDKMGGTMIDSSRFVPFASKLSSGKNIIEAGKHLSLAGQYMLKAGEAINVSISRSEQEQISLLDVFKETDESLKKAHEELKEANLNLEKVNIDDIPEEDRGKFILLKQELPGGLSIVEYFLNNSHIFSDLLGGNGPRKYLFLFQNNQEMRATGGFIGSYGLLDIKDGHVRNFFIDGIFNPDGQLKDKIVPPKPIQKISAAWSLHDSNWFPDFPTSAEEAIVFYEKTGGPTADGIITLTPTVMEKLLEITGPIEMEDYDVTLTSENFIEKTQYKVEVDYDEEENRPKKILSDLAPIVLEKVLNSNDVNVIVNTIKVLSESLSEKHILLYSKNEDLQKIISNQGWSGEIKKTSGDYLSVINTNINGYKTDGVIDEKIEHKTEIQNDGSIIDTVTVTRKHNGGFEEYEWWNKVNSNYMRLFVPLGSELIEVEGQTREFVDSPLDYDALKFRRNELVEQEENNMEINEESGMRIYNQNGKTVFASWNYVSPQEIVVLRYKYLLPFKVKIDSENMVDSYSLLVQKQSGSAGSEFSSEISFPESYKVEWTGGEDLQVSGSSVKLETELDLDRFIGITFIK